LIIMADKIYTITQLTKELKDLLESSFSKVRVEGEISNYLKHSSGHRYFTLKDQGAQIKCVLWRWQGNSLLFEPQDGMKVKASGQVTIYEKSGQYQLVVSSLQPAGIGELELAFQQLKKKLAADGLFDPTHKAPIPQFPERIGVVTSPTGAAIKDILNITKRRAPHVEIILWPVAVQGEGAATQIAHAIRGFNQTKLVDVLIVGRGGGSLEDLWAFNEEVVARAIYESKLPVISAVGHEIDFSIADFVADLRAPTPSAAAEMAVPNAIELLERIDEIRQDLVYEMSDLFKRSNRRVKELGSRYGLKRPMEIITQRAQRRDELNRLISLHFAHRMDSLSSKSHSIFEKLEMVSPQGILKRGYAYVRDEKGQSIRSFKQVAIDDKLEIIFYEGGAESRVTRIKPKTLGGGRNDENRS
jgi:exodeoxyribonuclease VII large subunit